MKQMSYKGFSARIMKARRLTGDHIHGLPPGHEIDVYPVDEFEHPLSHWITGSGNYVVPVDSDWGLWFDWAQNDQMNTAVLPTVKGMNPITGRRTSGFALESYENAWLPSNLQKLLQRGILQIYKRDYLYIRNYKYRV